ncbi:hypothetical protein [Photobacterium kagoshimensis]|uniref:hypothetical protein n=1 Tax=Photobacterium kagoshimensis TaxID=2910242 RepID=UPI003D1403F4
MASSDIDKRPLKHSVVGLLLHIPIVLSLWLLAAHSLRFGHIVIFGLLLLSPLLLVVRQRIVLRACQVFLFSGALFWVYTTYGMLVTRLAMGDDWLRLLLIMSGVIFFTLIASCLCMHSKVERAYR